MKKLICLLFSLLLLSGCSPKDQGIKPIIAPLEFTAEIKNNQTVNFKGKTYLENDKLIMSLTDENSNTTYNFSGNIITISHQDLSYKGDLSALPQNLSLDFLYDSFTAIQNKTLTAVPDKNDLIIEAKSEKYNFKAYFGAMGIPIKLENRDTNQTIIIKNSKSPH